MGKLWAIGEAPAPSMSKGWGRDQHPGFQDSKSQEGPQDHQHPQHHDLRHPLTAVLCMASVKGECHASLSCYLKEPGSWKSSPPGSEALPSSNNPLVPTQLSASDPVLPGPPWSLESFVVLRKQ